MGKIKIEKFEDLKCWQNSIDLTKEIYMLFNDKILAKEFSLKDQMFRSAISISSNIAEGFEYNSSKEFLRFLKYAKGSCGELRSQLYVVENVFDLKTNELRTNCNDIGKMIKGLMKYLASTVEK